jgi:hypothetical protein
MPVFLRVRWAAFRLVRALRRSILAGDEEWELDSDSHGRPLLTAGPFRIVIAPRAIRLFDAIHLYVDGVEVWLPILARLRLRNAVRWLVLQHARARLLDIEAQANKGTRPRKRTRQTAS